MFPTKWLQIINVLFDLHRFIIFSIANYVYIWKTSDNDNNIEHKVDYSAQLLTWNQEIINTLLHRETVAEQRCVAYA